MVTSPAAFEDIAAVDNRVNYSIARYSRARLIVVVDSEPSRSRATTAATKVSRDPRRRCSMASSVYLFQHLFVELLVHGALGEQTQLHLLVLVGGRGARRQGAAGRPHRRRRRAGTAAARLAAVRAGAAQRRAGHRQAQLLRLADGQRRRRRHQRTAAAASSSSAAASSSSAASSSAGAARRLDDRSLEHTHTVENPSR